MAEFVHLNPKELIESDRDAFISQANSFLSSPSKTYREELIENDEPIL